MNLNKKGQNEMVGFVLIVVVVVIALMVFLIISVRQGGDDMVESGEVDALLQVMLSYTTDCAVVFEPQYSSLEDLLKDCYENKRCSNLDRMACDYRDEVLGEIMGDVMKTEADVSAYELEVFYRNGEEQDVLYEKFSGNCTGAVIGSQRNILVDEGDLVVRLRFCRD